MYSKFMFTTYSTCNTYMQRFFEVNEMYITFGNTINRTLGGRYSVANYTGIQPKYMKWNQTTGSTPPLPYFLFSRILVYGAYILIFQYLK